MVLTMDPEKVRSDAVTFFQQSELPESLEWAAGLSPVNQRLFAVELADGLKEAAMTGNVHALATLVADWQATAELDAVPEVIAEIRRLKNYLPISTFITT